MEEGWNDGRRWGWGAASTVVGGRLRGKLQGVGGFANGIGIGIGNESVGVGSYGRWEWYILLF